MPTFAQLKTMVSGRLIDPNNQAATASDVGYAINAAIAKWKQQQFWFNTQTDTVTLASGSATVPLTTNVLYFLKQDGIVIDWANAKWPLKKVVPEFYDNANVEGQGMPYMYTWKDNSWVVYYIPDQDYTMTVRFVQDYTDLTNDSDTNDFTTYAPNLIMYEALSNLYLDFRQDIEMSSRYADRAKQEFVTLTDATYRRAASGFLVVESII